MDVSWWQMHREEVSRAFAGTLYSTAALDGKYGVRHLPVGTFKAFGNSGAGCINVAVHGGARKVVLLGYDCQRTNGQSHWHGDHPRGLGNAGRMDSWARKFGDLLDAIKDKADVVNCSRETALTCFRRGELAEELR